MADITLNASMRSNLLSLQNTQKLMDMTQERLSTGNKVNSAIDNPSSYYTAQSLNNRASDLSALLDSMGQAIQTIKAANEGIEAITTFVEQAKAVANTALDTADLNQITSSQDQFNNIIEQIDKLAADSGYKGVNLLQGDDLTVVFNEDRSSNLEIIGDEADSAGLDLSRATGWNTVNTATSAAEEAIADIKKKDITVEELQYTGDAKVGTYKLIDVSAGKLPTSAYDTKDGATAKDKYTTLTTEITDYNTLLSGADPTEANAKTAYDAVQTAYNEYKAAVVADYQAELSAAEEALKPLEEADVAARKTAIQNSIIQASDAINELRAMASTFGNNFSIVENRENFTESLINVLTEGADKLVLADMNEESANMLALQTRQQLGINSLSLASQASQAVLKLF